MKILRARRSVRASGCLINDIDDNTWNKSAMPLPGIIRRTIRFQAIGQFLQHVLVLSFLSMSHDNVDIITSWFASAIPVPAS